MATSQADTYADERAMIDKAIIAYIFASTVWLVILTTTVMADHDMMSMMMGH